MDHHGATADLTDTDLGTVRWAAAVLAGQTGTGVPRDALVALADAATRPLTVWAPEPGSSVPVVAVVGPPRAGSHPVFTPLSDREREVAALVAAGNSNQEIARRLVVTVGTVKDHVHRILAKTGLDSRAKVAAAWHHAQIR